MKITKSLGEKNMVVSFQTARLVLSGDTEASRSDTSPVFTPSVQSRGRTFLKKTQLL